MSDLLEKMVMFSESSRAQFTGGFMFFVEVKVVSMAVFYFDPEWLCVVNSLIMITCWLCMIVLNFTVKFTFTCSHTMLYKRAGKLCFASNLVCTLVSLFETSIVWSKKRSMGPVLTYTVIHWSSVKEIISHMWGTDSEQHPLPPCAYQPKDPLIAGKTILSRSLPAHSTLHR